MYGCTCTNVDRSSQPGETLDVRPACGKAFIEINCKGGLVVCLLPALPMFQLL